MVGVVGWADCAVVTPFAQVRTDSNTLADAITWSNTAAVVVRNLMMRQASPMTFSKKMLKLMYDPI